MLRERIFRSMRPDIPRMCNGNAQRMGSPFDEAGYSRMEFYSLLPRPVRKIASLISSVMSW